MSTITYTIGLVIGAAIVGLNESLPFYLAFPICCALGFLGPWLDARIKERMK